MTTIIERGPDPRFPDGRGSGCSLMEQPVFRPLRPIIQAVPDLPLTAMEGLASVRTVDTPRARRLKLVATVARKHGFRLADLLGRGRQPARVLARREAMHAVAREFGDGPKRIGQLFGCDHSTAFYHLRGGLEMRHAG